MEWTMDDVGTSPQGAFLQVKASGEMDLYHAPRFTQELLGRIANGCRRLLIDLSEVHYLDSSGVGALIRIMQHMAGVKGTVRFVGVTGSPRKVLEMSNIISLMRIYPHVEDAERNWDGQ